MVAKLKIFIENDKKTCAIYSISHSNLCHLSFQLDANHAVICIRLHCNLRQVAWLSASSNLAFSVRMQEGLDADGREGNMGRDAFPL